MLQEGQKFGVDDRYLLIKQLGRGGFSEVWLADDNVTHVQVAIKIYAPGTGLDAAGIEIFTKEFSLVFELNHTNLLKPTYFDNYENQPYLILPLCKNGSAFKYISGGRRITEEECWNMLHDVGAGLAYLHSKNPPIIHQDIKPDNILINDEGHYMITDFGISARVRSTIRRGRNTKGNGGTLAYMAPERFSSRPKPIMASDVWSLGAMMYELMTGDPPFGDMGGSSQRAGDDIPPIEENYSQQLKDLVYQCLDKEPVNRPLAQTIEDLTYKYLHGMAWGSEDMSRSVMRGSIGGSRPIGGSIGGSRPIDGSVPYGGSGPLNGSQPKNNYSEQMRYSEPITNQQSVSYQEQSKGNSNKTLIIVGIVAAAVVIIAVAALIVLGGK